MQKGPVIGPLVLCGVCFKETNLDFLTKIGVKDSKKLSAKKRSELALKILQECYSHKLIIVSPEEIDDRNEKKITLNRLEELKMAEIIDDLKPDVVYIDAVDVNEKRFGKSIGTLLNKTPKKIISEHEADDTYPIVSAASIVAKVKRDSIIAELRNKYGDLGSGYPSDKKTINFLRDWIKTKKEVPSFVRKTWDTTKKLIEEELTNKKITDYT